MSIKQGLGQTTTLWVNGVSHAITMLWMTGSHAEIIVGEDVRLPANQLTAVIAREFLSLPMRVVAQTGQNVVLHHVQKPHQSVLDLIDADLLERGIDQLRDVLEERAFPHNPVADFEVWCEEADEEYDRPLVPFTYRVHELESDFELREHSAAA